MDVDTIDERLALFRAMAAHAGVDLPTRIAADAPEEVVVAAQRCLGCRNAPDCHRWFDAQATDAGAGEAPVPGFCRNAALFEAWKGDDAPSPAAG